MNIALAIYRLMPAGGLERHALRIAVALRDRGHRITIFTTGATEAVPPGIETVRLSVAAATNHGVMSGFSTALRQETKSRAALVVGFQKLAGLDALFCADWSYAERRGSGFGKLLPRVRTMLALERACFGADARTRLLLLSQPQCAAYLADYPHAAARITVLPPTIDMRHHGSSPPSASRRSAARERRGLPLTATIWLWIGIQPDVKGLDRVIAAIEVRPEATLLVCGLPAGERAPAAGRAKVMGVVSDEELSDLFEAADLLIHPARLDVTGSVILEAMAHGLPVITTANCGFSTHVAAADAGVVLPVPFGAPALLRALDGASAERRESWAQHAYAYCNDPNLYSGIARACDEIEAAAERR